MEFLGDMSKRFELIIYTAAAKDYADTIVDYIELRQKYFSFRLYKEHCIYQDNGLSFKFLDILCGNRELKDIVIIDNCVRNYALSIRNGLPIKDFIGDNADSELVHLAKYMHKLDCEEDIPSRIKNDFSIFLDNH